MRRRVALLASTLGVLAGTTTLGSRAEAQCAAADALDAIPPDGASDVPTNTPLSASYEIGAVHNGEPVLVTRSGQATEELAATYSTAVRTLRATLPEGALEAGAEYSVEWPALTTGGDDPRRGRGLTVKFSVGSEADMSRPNFEGARSLGWDFEREYDSCSNTESERYLFELGLPQPSFAGGSELLSVMAFQTNGQNLEKDASGRPVPVPVYNQRYTGARSITVKRSIADGVGKVCFSAIMQAPNGMISAGVDKEVCTVTERPPFFDGCNVGSASTRSRPWSLAWLGLGLVLVELGKRRRGGARRLGHSRVEARLPQSERVARPV